MKIKNIYLTIALMLIGFCSAMATQPTTQTREVLPGGGGTSTGGVYTNFSVVGEPVVGSEQSGAYSGSTHGFLAGFGQPSGAPTPLAVTETYDGLEASPLTVTGDANAEFRWYSEVALTNLVHTGASFAHGKVDAGVYTYYVVQVVDGVPSAAASAILTINKAPLSVFAEQKSRVFNTANPTFTVTYTGLVNGETATVIDVPPTITCGATLSSPVGSYSIIPSGGSDNNYSFTAYNNALLYITKAPVTFTLSDAIKTYNGATQSATIGNDKSLVLGIDYTVSGNSRKDFGTNNINITLSNNNYSMTNAAAIGSLVINKVALTVKADDKIKTYGGSDPANSATLTGFVNGELAANVISGTAAFSRQPGENVGEYTITPTIGSLTATNYSFDSFETGKLTINKANVEFTLSNATKTYSGVAQSATISNNKSLVLNTDYTVTGNSGVNANTYPISIALIGNALTNYNMTSAPAIGSLVINKAALSATAQNKSRCFNTANPEFTITYSGFVNGETKSAITEPTASTLAVLASPAGPYAITLAGGSAANYDLTLNNGTLTVNALPVPTISGVSATTQDAEVTLSTQSGKSGYSWAIDGATVVGANNASTITLTWATEGNKSVTVTYTDANGCTGTSAPHSVAVSSGCSPVTIVTDPIATTVCDGSAATFTVAVSGSAPTYAWYKSGGNTVLSTTNSLVIPNAQASDAGDYYVVVDNACTDGELTSAYAALTVNAKQTPSVAVLGNTSVCSGSPITFTADTDNLGGGTAAYTWYIGATEQIGETNATFTTSALVDGDNVSCKITITNGCVTTNEVISTPKTIAVTPLAQQASAIVGDAVVCASTAVNYSVTYTPNITYTWSFTDANAVISAGQGTNAITLTLANNSVSGTLSVVASNGCNNAIARELAVTVNAVPVFTADNNPKNAGVAIGANTQFNTTVAATSFQWQVSIDGGTVWNNIDNANATDIYTGALTNTLVLTNVPDTTYNGYKYRVLASNNCGTNIASSAARLGIAPAAATLTYSSKTSSWLKFNYSAPAGANTLVLAYIGTVADATILANKPTNGKAYIASAIFNAGDTVGTAGGRTVANDQNTQVTISGLVNNTTYKAVAFSYIWDGSDPSTIVYGPASAIASGKTLRKEGVEIEEPLATSLFEVCRVNPNPVSSEMNFCIDATQENNFTIELFSASGELVMSQAQLLSAGSHAMKLDLSTQKGGIAAGTYFLKVSAGGETLIQQVVVIP